MMLTEAGSVSREKTESVHWRKLETGDPRPALALSVLEVRDCSSDTLQTYKYININW